MTMTLDLSKPISAAMLAKAGACPKAVAWVRKTYGTKPVRLTRARLLRAAAVVEVGWLSLFLPARARAAYRKAAVAAWAAYNMAFDTARAAYNKAIDTARAAYAKDFDLAAYDKAIDKAWAAYDAARDKAWAAYDEKARVHALADALRLP